ncbi:heavy-metal-associated domain-containing protein [Geitlerinema sp. PCC 9228]|jgi:copper chaperone|uniref:heavy-metal-associated domain-containing protein n=1 Tax=Geitlerinema sp. PCC 9228 TaxID=111611 RepID=UPI0008F98972|nr:heavy-metal-associated domain-containing protein [Geitlerinema sp. PCC 9228]
MSITYKVSDMACSACAENITKAIQSIDAGARVNADPESKLVQVETQQPDAQVQEAIAKAGYTPTPA